MFISDIERFECSETALKMYRTIRMRVEPTAEQREFIDLSILYHCYIYNGLKTFVKLYFSEHGKLPSHNELNSVCTKIWQNHECFHTIYQNSMNYTSKRILQAFKSCNPTIRSNGNRNSEGLEEGSLSLKCPRYKKPERFNSFGYLSNNTFKIISYRRSGGRMKRGIKLGKMTGVLKCYNQNTPLPGIPKTITVSRENLGTHFEYYATIQYE